MSRILVVDDEKAIRESLREIFEYEGHKVEDAENAPSALELLRNEIFDVVFCDIKMPGMDGVEFLTKAMEFSSVPFVMISAHGSIETAVECIKIGAFDFISKPLDLNRILVSLRNAVNQSQLEKETKRLKKKVGEEGLIIGDSEALREVLDMADKVAVTDARVLILGESGTGKELLARRIHQMSERASGPYIEVNCAAIPSELIESELFGHEKGSFTSAIKQKKGSFELASEGSLFLDEIGDMSLSAQAKVLRALQENKITRVGGEKSIDVKPRLIAATNKNLKEEIAAGRFREDLYHRLSVIVLKIPSLSERKEDIPLLIEHFVKQIAVSSGKSPKKIDAKAVKILQSKTYTGNIRELRNVVERLFILGADPISATDVEKYCNFA